MHACLDVDEVVRLIAHELVTSRGKATAVSLACCRKSFEDPVLDALWAEQDMLLPLLKSFPCDVWKEGGYSVSVSIACLFSLCLCLSNYPIRKSFKRLPTTTEWAHFRKYARRNDARAQTMGHSKLPVQGNFLGHPTLHRQRTLTPESENSHIEGSTRMICSVYPLVPFPQNHLRLPLI